MQNPISSPGACQTPPPISTAVRWNVPRPFAAAKQASLTQKTSPRHVFQGISGPGSLDLSTGKHKSILFKTSMPLSNCFVVHVLPNHNSKGQKHARAFDDVQHVPSWPPSISRFIMTRAGGGIVCHVVFNIPHPPFHFGSSRLLNLAVVTYVALSARDLMICAEALDDCASCLSLYLLLSQGLFFEPRLRVFRCAHVRVIFVGYTTCTTEKDSRMYARPPASWPPSTFSFLYRGTD